MADNVVGAGPASLGGAVYQVPQQGSVTIPAIGANPLRVPTRQVVVTGAGNLSVEFADGSLVIQVVPVTAGMTFDWAVTRFITGNTAVAFGLR